MIAALEKAGDPLARDFRLASERAAAGARVARGSGDYPLLARGDLNLYSLFVERAMTLVKPDGMVGLLVPSGIASDKTAAPFFKSVATEGRLKALYDFENKKVFFPDVHASFKFCVFAAFYDALETNDSAVRVLGDETLRDIARELVEIVRNNVRIDRALRENVRANLRRLVKRILRKHGYPPDKQEKGTRTVLEQAEVLSAGWTA